MMAFVRLIGRCGLATTTTLILAFCCTVPATASTVATHTVPPDFVLANGSGSDIQLESASTGALVKDLGAVQGYTNNGLALSPDGQDVYVTANKPGSLVIERIRVANDQETFVADGEQPAISPSGTFLAYGTGSEGSEELVVRDLMSGTVRTVSLQKLLGGQTDLLNATITWLRNSSTIVVLPGEVANDLMGEPIPPPVPGSCSAVSISQTCLIVVHAGTGDKFTAKRVILRGLERADIVAGASGSRDLVMAAFGARHTVLYRADVTEGAGSVIRLFSLPPDLPVAFDAQGSQLLYLIGHGPVALWLAQVTSHGLKNARMLNANVAEAGVAW